MVKIPREIRKKMGKKINPTKKEKVKKWNELVERFNKLVEDLHSQGEKKRVKSKRD